MFLVLMYLIFVPVNVFANIEATLGLDMNNGTKINIASDSTFVGMEDSVDVPQKLWCRGNEDWDVCSWLWQNNPDGSKQCEFIEGNSNNGCTDQFINIDKEGTDCTIIFYKGFNKANHEGPWECRLIQISEPGKNFSDNVQANLRILSPPTIQLNASDIKIYKDEESYVEGKASDAYPATSITWKVEERNLLDVPKETCAQSVTDFCEPMASVLRYVGNEGDSGKNLNFIVSQTDSFGNIVATSKIIPIDIIDDGTNGGGVVWTAGKMT